MRRWAAVSAVAQYLQHLAAERRLSPHTVTAYQRDLANLARLAGDKPLAELGVTDIRGAIVKLRSKRLVSAGQGLETTLDIRIYRKQCVSLAQAGYGVTVYDKNPQVGGKLNFLKAAGYSFDLGPSILTLPHVFEALFTRSGPIYPAPDLAIEVLSPSNRRVAVEEKLSQYFSAGTRAVWLVDARQLRHAPGRPKSDVLDCQWIQRLMALGLLRAAVRPAADVCVVRAVVRALAVAGVDEVRLPCNHDLGRTVREAPGTVRVTRAAAATAAPTPSARNCPCILRLNTSRAFSHLPGLGFPRRAGTFPT